MKKPWFVFSFLAAFWLGIAGTVFASSAVAQVVPSTDGNIWDLAKPVLDAVKGGQYAFAAALGLVFLVAAIRKYHGTRWPFLNTDAGGALLTLVASFGGAMATGMAATGAKALTFGLAWASVGIAVMAAGGYSLIKKMLVDPLLASAWYANKAPAWFKSIMSLVLWIFVRPDPVVDAEAAGKAAVAAKPAGGVEAVVGKPEQF